jgi:glycosyltransferase involved in cell wall biosynthesis
MTRILYVMRNMKPGGAETFLLSMLQRINGRRVSADVATLYGGGQLKDEFERTGARIYELNFRNVYDVGGYRRLIQLIRNNAYDVVHTKLFHADFAGRICARAAGVRRIFSTVESAHEWVGARHIKDHLKYAAFRYSAHLNRRVIAVSYDIRRALVENVGLDARLIEVIPNGVDVELFDPNKAGFGTLRTEFGLSADALTVGAVGTLNPVKCHKTFILSASEVMRRHPNVFFFIVGRGDQKALRQLAHEQGVAERVIFTGVRRDISNVLASLNVYVMTSLSEGISLSLLEAMAMARPVIATSVGGNVEIINSPDVGLLYSADDCNSLARSIVELLLDRSYRKTLGDRARERVQDAYNLSKTLARYDMLYRMSA